MNRVRRHTSESAAQRVDAVTRANVRKHGAERAQIGRRIAELEREWDIERTLESNAGTIALSGALLGTLHDRRWFGLTGFVMGFLFQHATSGWCPPIPVLRRLGVRTGNEIDQERFALKAVRGDFRSASNGEASVEQALEAVTPSESVAVEHRREPDRIRRYTTNAQQRRLDAAMAQRVRLYAGQIPEMISARIAELEREWSIERYLQVNVALVGLTTTALAVGKNRKWGYATCAGLAFFLFHAVEGFDPPLPALRRMGIRSRDEINREVYALKILRGDFDSVLETSDDSARVEAALTAVGL